MITAMCRSGRRLLSLLTFKDIIKTQKSQSLVVSGTLICMGENIIPVVIKKCTVLTLRVVFQSIAKLDQNSYIALLMNVSALAMDI